MKRISDVISELQVAQARMGDVFVVCRHPNSGKTFNPGAIGGNNIAEINLSEIKPQTAEWKDFCNVANGTTV